MNPVNYRALFSLTVEELLLAENVSDAEWLAIYRPQADRGENRQPAHEGGPGHDVNPGAQRVAGLGQSPRRAHISGAQS